MYDLKFVTSSVAVFEAAIWVKINVYDKIVKKQKRENMVIKEIYA